MRVESTNKIVDLQEAKKTVEAWQQNGEKVVFTNGCFDIIHLGHVDYLERSKGVGDRLVIGLNTDQSISRIKGSSRPIISEVSRSRVLAAFGFVDLVVLFEEETPLELISAIMPDILVKGNDYLAENIVGANIVKQNQGEVITIPLVEGYSTSSIIEKIKK